MKENDRREYLDSYIRPLQECRNALTNDVSIAYHERKADIVLENISKEFGFERVSFLIANHVSQQLFDGRYDRKTKDWAVAQAPLDRFSDMPDDIYDKYKRNLSLGNTHPVIVNYIANWVMENENNKEFFKAPKAKESAKEKLNQRVENELKKYEDWLLELPKNEILNHTYEHSVLCDIVFVIRDEDMVSEETAEKLLKSPDILSDLSKDLDKLGLNINAEICSVIEERAVKSAEKNKDTGVGLNM